MKKNHKTILVVFLVMIAVFVLAGGGKLFTLFYGTNDVRCNFMGNDLSCSAGGAGATGNEFTAPKVGDTFSFTIEQSNLYDLKNKQFANFLPGLESQNPSIASFFASHTRPVTAFSSFGQTLLLAEPGDDVNAIKSLFGDSIQSAWDSDFGSWYRIYNERVIDRFFPNALVIVDGTISDRRDSPTKTVTFSTYGFCNMITGECKVLEPSIAYSEFPDGRYHGVISSIVIKLKSGGVDESTTCGINENRCSGNEVISCENNVLTNKGNVEGSCGYSTNPSGDNPSAENESDTSDTNANQNIFLIIGGILLVIALLIVIFLKVFNR